MLWCGPAAAGGTQEERGTRVLHPSDLRLPASLTPDTRERLLAIFELAPIGIGLVDFEGHTIMSNEVLREMLGYSREEFAQMRFEEFTHPDDNASNAVFFAQLSTGEIESFEIEKRFIHKNGSLVWGRLTTSLLRDDDGTPDYAIGMVEDITEKKSLSERLGAVQERYRLLVERVPAVVYIAEPGAAGKWHYVSPQSEEMLGFNPDDLVDDPDLWLRQIHPDDRAIALGDEDAIIDKRGEVLTSYYRMIRRDGEVIWVRDDAMAVWDENGELMFHGLLVDVTREKDLEARLEHQAFHDPLTQLPNRRLFRDRVDHCLKRLARRPEDRAAVLFVDLDNFKSVNDGLGHLYGDELLMLVAERISGCLRGGDTAARLGGDEFALLIEDLDSECDAVVLAERILKGIRGEPFMVGERPISVGASIGIAVQGPSDTAETLLRNADLAMYRAKAQGRDGFAVFETEMHDRASMRLRLEGALAVGCGWHVRSGVRSRPLHPVPTDRGAGHR